MWLRIDTELIEAYTKELAEQPERGGLQQQVYWLKGTLHRARCAPKGAHTINTGYNDGSVTVISTLCDHPTMLALPWLAQYDSILL